MIHICICGCHPVPSPFRHLRTYIFISVFVQTQTTQVYMNCHLVVILHHVQENSFLCQHVVVLLLHSLHTSAVISVPLSVMLNNSI